MAAKVQSQDQLKKYQMVLKTKSCDPSVSGAWDTNAKLKAAFSQFTENILPTTESTRMIMMQQFDGWVRRYSKQPEKWLEYLAEHKYCEGLIDTMKVQASKGKRIEHIPDRYTMPKLDEKVLAAEPVGAAAQKKKKLEDAKKETDEVFKKELDEQQQAALTAPCPVCRWQVRGSTRQVRRGDEEANTTEQCENCGFKKRY